MEKNSSKILSGGESGDFQQWKPPNMGQSKVDGSSITRPSSGMLTADKLEKLQKQAYDEGFKLGKKEGFDQGLKEAKVEGAKRVQTSVAKLESLIRTLDTPLKQLDEQIERELVDLSIAMVRQLVRREVRADSSQIVGVVREALAILPVASRNVRIMLHPEDASIIRDIYSMSDQEQGWVINEDPLVSRGGCRVVTDTSQVDATLESRLANIIAPLLGGERDADSENPGEE